MQNPPSQSPVLIKKSPILSVSSRMSKMSPRKFNRVFEVITQCRGSKYVTPFISADISDISWRRASFTKTGILSWFAIRQSWLLAAPAKVNKYGKRTIHRAVVWKNFLIFGNGAPGCPAHHLRRPDVRPAVRRYQICRPIAAKATSMGARQRHQPELSI